MDLENLREKALKALKTKDENYVGAFKEKSLEELLSELGVYAEELHVQNEQLQEQIIENEALNKLNLTLYENAPNPYLILNKKFEIIKANKKALETFEIMFERQDIFRLVPPKSIAVFMSWFGKFLQQESLDIQMLTSKGVRWHRVSVDYFEDIFMITCNDIDSSIEEKKRFETLLKVSTDGIHIVDADGKVVECSESFAKMLGYSYKEALKLDIYDWAPEMSLEKIRMLQEQMKKGVVHFDAKFQKRDGNIIDVEITGQAVEIHDQVFFHTSARDITLKKIHEKELQELNENLSKQVEEKVLELRQKEHALLAQQRLAQMGEMLQMIAHQWRQPLNNLSVGLQTLFKKFHSGKSDAKFLQTMQKDLLSQLMGLSATISDFQNYFLPSKEARIFKPKELVDETLHFIEHAIVQCRVEVKVDIPEDLTMLGYRGEVGQIFLAIISNAKDQFEELKCEKRVITIEGVEEAKDLRFTISDTAGGIPNDVMAYVFDPYFTTKSERNGSGIGLYMVKMMVEQSLGGAVKAFNNEDGACFEITLPKELVKEG